MLKRISNCYCPDLITTDNNLSYGMDKINQYGMDKINRFHFQLGMEGQKYQRGDQLYMLLKISDRGPPMILITFLS